MKRHPVRAVLALALLAVSAAAQAPKPAGAVSATIGEPEAIVVWNREIAVLRAGYEQATPRERARAAAERIRGLPVQGPWTIETLPSEIGALRGVFVTVDGRILFGIMDQDVLPESGDTALDVARRASDNLLEYLEARRAQAAPVALLRAAGLALAFTLILALIAAGVFLLRRVLLRATDRHAASIGRRVHLREMDLKPVFARVEQRGIRLAGGLLIVVAAYLWLGRVLRLFPYTRPWGEQLRSYLLGALQGVVVGIVRAMPDLFMLAVIFMVARFVTRLVGTFFLGVERGLVKSDRLSADTARATRRIVGVLLWAFALTVAYPYIPGSSSAAFKGVSVFLGLMLSLGSTGMINQIVSGLVVVYSGAFRTGDLVRISETEGVVSAVGLLSTRITTPKKEEVSVPNALLVSTPAWNLSAFAGGRGAMLSTTVTIGYDVPWRQVHALLLEAAAATAALSAEPAPFVIQKSLSNVFVEYLLIAHVKNPLRRVPILSELHGHIQDRFNAHGVQIMTPNYESQPPEKVWVPVDKWQTPPARGGADEAGGDPGRA
jgi:small-conductance mechanosensitive channel